MVEITDLPQLPKVILKILQDLNQYFTLHQTPHVIVGGVVVNIWGRNRMTNDVDVIVDQHSLDIPTFVNFLTKKGYSITEYELQEGFKEQSNITIFYESFRIDLVGVYRKSQQTQIHHAKQLNLFDLDLKFDSPETLIANKLYFGSIQDLEDALSVYIRNDLDHVKLQEFSEELGVSQMLVILKRMSKEPLSEEEIEKLLDELHELL